MDDVIIASDLWTAASTPPNWSFRSFTSSFVANSVFCLCEERPTSISPVPAFCGSYWSFGLPNFLGFNKFIMGVDFALAVIERSFD